MLPTPAKADRVAAGLDTEVTHATPKGASFGTAFVAVARLHALMATPPPLLRCLFTPLPLASRAPSPTRSPPRACALWWPLPSSLRHRART
jgi:hypothetical protein